jgi:hypothetical protein
VCRPPVKWSAIVESFRNTDVIPDIDRPVVIRPETTQLSAETSLCTSSVYRVPRQCASLAFLFENTLLPQRSNPHSTNHNNVNFRVRDVRFSWRRVWDDSLLGKSLCSLELGRRTRLSVMCCLCKERIFNGSFLPLYISPTKESYHISYQISKTFRMLEELQEVQLW